MEKYRLQLKLKNGQSLGYIQMDNGEPYYDYGYSEATLFDPIGVLDLLKGIPFDHYDVFAEVPYTTNKGRKGKTALRNEELKTYMQNELNDKSEQFMENKIMKNEQMYDELGNAITPEEYAKGVEEGTVNEKMFDEYGKEVTPEEYAKGVADGTINETVEDETNDCMLALEDYLVNEEGVSLEDVEIKTGYGEDEYTTDYGDYYVFDDYDKAVAAAVEYEKQILDDIGIDALNWDYMPYEIGHYVDRNWFQEAMEESNQSYIDDIRDEAASSDEFESRLEEEMADAGVTTEEEYLEHLNNNYADPIDWYRDNFGDEDFNQVVKEKGLVDLDAVAEGVVETDGPANALAGYDGKEVEWEFDGNYYYIYRNN